MIYADHGSSRRSRPVKKKTGMKYAPKKKVTKTTKRRKY